jgi:hypothetical protein
MALVVDCELLREDAMLNQPPPPPPQMPGQLTQQQVLDWNKWVHERNIDWQKWLYEQNVKAAERAHDKSDEFRTQVNQAAIQGGNLALRMGLIINGGAAIALLPFIGNLPTDQKRAAAASLAYFAWGVAVATGALATAYFTNYYVARSEQSRRWQPHYPYVLDGGDTSKWRLLSQIFRGASILLGLGSLTLFMVGMLSVQAAFTKLG